MKDSQGFSLVELAVVLVIVGLLLGGLLMPLSAQMDVRGYQDTSKRLEEAKEAIIGFAMANGRLPCPASSTSLGIEDPGGGGDCNHDYDGFLPAATLGLSNVDGGGYAMDGWSGNSVNRIRYAVTTANASAFTTPGGMRGIGMATLAPALRVCTSGSGVTATTCGTATSLTTTAVAVIFSAGKNASTGGTGTDESKNYDDDQVFVSHEPVPGANEFDDSVTWISPNLLYSRMVAAGQLP
ncbi:MAG TPA: prepilin-type N-terminal cleavage/methylation domain-containing protein [Methylophilaceae bacterium]|nr:prepilin-type N-terminal cleavage/methylation domain-containing protein [Methylophilaceae bacterium]HQR60046.1 prepilin-type N-terminal cleavage/methylation domain-containing protein [Methylophilaceae bacterium]